ncbi:MAG: SMP-30/gluconolactonase/LRE family protein, partial [Tannerella sp.]|nr:SMP-30/gluconolactonase/LRE family protein [Tannerella sp.]
GILVSAKEKVYVAQRLPGGERAIWSLDAKGNKTLEDKLLHGGVQLAFSPDQQWLVSSEEHSHWVYVYTVDENGKLSNGCRYYWLHNTDNSDFDRKGNMAFDSNKVLYVATPIGIQVSETRGLALAILTLPSGGKISSICFGGENRDVLFAVSGGKLYYRKMKIKGA